MFTVRQITRGCLLALGVTSMMPLTGAYAAHSCHRMPAQDKCVSLDYRTYYEVDERVSYGKFKVPQDYNRPDYDMIELAYLVRLANHDPESKETLWINYGGPGVPSILAFERRLLEDRFPQELLDEFNIVILDARGTGFSAYADKLIQRKHTGLAPHLSTRTYVEDVESLRQHLSDLTIEGIRLQQLDKINLLGLSYGALAMAKYADEHPTHVRSLILDGMANFNASKNPNYNAELIQVQQDLSQFSFSSNPIEFIDGNLSRSSGIKQAVRRHQDKWSAPDRISVLINCTDQGFQPGIVSFEQQSSQKIIYYKNNRICRKVERDLLTFEAHSNLAHLPFPTLMFASRFDQESPYVWTQQAQEQMFDNHAVTITVTDTTLHGLAFFSGRMDLINTHILSYLHDPMSYTEIASEQNYTVSELNP